MSKHRVMQLDLGNGVRFSMSYGENSYCEPRTGEGPVTKVEIAIIVNNNLSRGALDFVLNRVPCDYNDTVEGYLGVDKLPGAIERAILFSEKLGKRLESAVDEIVESE